MVSAALWLYPVMIFDDGRQLSEPVEIAAAQSTRGADQPSDADQRPDGGPERVEPLRV